MPAWCVCRIARSKGMGLTGATWHQVEYETVGWLDKNKDPINDNVAALFFRSSNELLAKLFEDADDDVRDRTDPTAPRQHARLRCISCRWARPRGWGTYIYRRTARSGASRPNSSPWAPGIGYVGEGLAYKAGCAQPDLRGGD
jgi:hypothetical protein